jgi:hypothetical protein
MLQVATPYEGMGAKVSDLEDEEGKNAQALDKWVEMIQKKYPGQKAVWAEPLPEAALGEGGTAVESETKPYIDMIRRIMIQQANGDQNEIASWDDTMVLMEFAKGALKDATGFDPSFFGSTPKAILDNVMGMLPELPAGTEKTEKENP